MNNPQIGRIGVASDQSGSRDEAAIDNPRVILERLRALPGNPVSRARRIVEMQVPPSQRGPGWDRHWRELEAYLETPMNWTGATGDISLDADPDLEDPDQSDPATDHPRVLPHGVLPG